MRIRIVLALVVLTLASCSQKFESGAEILLYSGAGTSANDVRALKSILNDGGLSYSTIDSQQLNATSEAQLLQSRLLIVPGGNYLEIVQGLTPESLEKIRGAVNRGLNYLGICAGAILAGHSDDTCLNLTSGVKFGFYDDVNRGIHKNVVSITTAGNETLDQYWEDGPELSGWGSVVSKYPDESPATVQSAVGDGFVILCGFHPEAPENWRRGMEFSTSVESSNAYALMLIHAALHGRELPHY